MGGKSGKGKGKPDNKKKNKKGKNQETSQNTSPQPESSSLEQEDQQEVEETPVLDSVPADTTVELASQSASGLQTPDQESELEQLQSPVEQDSAGSETEQALQSPTEDEGGFSQVANPDAVPSEEPGMNDAQEEQTQEPNQEELSSWDQLESADEIKESFDIPDEQNGTVEAPEQVPVTAPQSPQSPTFAPAAETTPQSPMTWEDDEPETSPPQENTNPFEESYTQDFPATNPFATSAPAEPPVEPAAADFTEFIGGPVTEPEEPAQEATPPASMSPSPEPQAPPSPSYKSVSPTPQAASPVPQAEALSSRSVSPMAQPMSPMKEAFSVPKAAPPTPPGASPFFHATYPMDQPYSPVQKTISPLQKHASPVRKPSTPLPKVGSPLAYAYASPVMSPHTTTIPPMAPTAPPAMPPGYVTAYQSPVMNSAGYPPQYAYYQQSPHPQQTPRHSIAHPNSGASFQALRDLGFVNGHDHHNRGTMSPPEHDEPLELLQRIQDAIPDINRLLGSYKNTKTKLQSREVEFKQMEKQHNQALMHKDFFIEALQNQMRKTANESAEESTKLKNMINELRMELGNLEEIKKDFEEKLADSEASIKNLTQSKSDLEDQVKMLNQNIEEEREEHEKALETQRVEKETEREEALATQKQELTELFEEIKAEDEKAAAEALAARENELHEQQEAMKAEYEQQKQQMQESHDTLQADFDSKVTELLATKEDLEQKQNELQDTREAHAKELEELNQAHTDKVESLENSHQEKVTEMENHMSEKEQQWSEEKTALETQIAEKSKAIEDLEAETKRLEEELVRKEEQVQHAVEGMRLTIDNLDKDCDRLRKTLHSLGEATDLKNTKGDSFFLDCFGQLSRLIEALSKEHFSYLPIDPPKEVLSKLPQELPSFLDNTQASRELRSAYVQHVISKTLTYRIFHPFLFTLGRRYDKADILFQMLSMDIRRKSVRREAFWRQQTLKAAYTTSDAKDSINVAAAVIVDEIYNHLKHFADPRRIDSLLTGIRKIVKLAAETWRHARVERELIIASLPAPEAQVTNEDWEEYGTPKEGSLSTRENPTRHVVLRPFPRITREAAHEDFVGDKEKADPCMYSQGSVLYSDSPIIIARLQELAKKSTDALAGGEGASRRGSRASNHSNHSEPTSPHGNPFANEEDLLLNGAGEENCAAA